MSQLKVNSIVPVGGLPSGANGGIIQVIQTVKTNTFSTTSTSLVDVTGLSVSITPSSSSNKILILIQCAVISGDAGSGLSIVRGSTLLYQPDSAGSRKLYSMSGHYGADGDNTRFSGGTNFCCFLDSPSTTSATTYKVQISGRSGQTTGVGFRTRDDNDDNSSREPSSITVMEVTV
tara:strand:+ start:911 stop:1438 length:528 start_codon:yes stop_codon:yes gene_type:complete